MSRMTNDFYLHSLEETAQALYEEGLADRVLTREAIRVIERKALQKIRDALGLDREVALRELAEPASYQPAPSGPEQCAGFSQRW
jgi:hypothetical protein